MNLYRALDVIYLAVFEPAPFLAHGRLTDLLRILLAIEEKFPGRLSFVMDFKNSTKSSSSMSGRSGYKLKFRLYFFMLRTA
jgi:hypothetical protein